MKSDKHLVWLNLKNLLPPDIAYWRERLPRIAREMLARHSIPVKVTLGNFGGDDLFALNAVDLDLHDGIDAAKYRFLEECLRAIIQELGNEPRDSRTRAASDQESVAICQ